MNLRMNILSLRKITEKANSVKLNMIAWYYRYAIYFQALLIMKGNYLKMQKAQTTICVYINLTKYDVKEHAVVELYLALCRYILI